MKKFKPLLLLLFPAMLLLSGCPESVYYPLVEIGSEKADKSVIGKWENSYFNPDFQKMNIQKGKDDKSLSINIDGVTEDYYLNTQEFTAWTTVMEGNKFLFTQPKGETSYYIYRYEFVGDKLITYEVNLTTTDKKEVKSTAELQVKVKEMIKNKKVSANRVEWSKK